MRCTLFGIGDAAVVSPMLHLTKKRHSVTNPNHQWGRTLTAVGFAAVAVIVGACSGTGSAIPSANQTFTNGYDAGTPPPKYAFSFQTVDAPQGQNDTRITGIDERPDMVAGVTGTAPQNFDGLVAHTPYPSSTGYREFRARNYPGAVGTYMAAMFSAFYQAGTVFSPPPNRNLQCTTCGVLYYGKGSGSGYGRGRGCSGGGCQWTFFQDPNEGTGACAVTEVLGIAATDIVVGYYKPKMRGCGTQAFEAYVGPDGESFADFHVPNADPYTTKATGENEKGNVVGTALFGGVTKGWYYVDASYCTRLMAPRSTATYPLGINWEDQIVGYYVDGQQHTHGFLLQNPASAKRVWQTIDEPQAHNFTVVSDINTHHYITGWYKDESGRTHGFVGTCKSCQPGSRQRQRQDPMPAPDLEGPRCSSKGMGRRTL